MKKKWNRLVDFYANKVSAAKNEKSAGQAASNIRKITSVTRHSMVHTMHASPFYFVPIDNGIDFSVVRLRDVFRCFFSFRLFSLARPGHCLHDVLNADKILILLCVRNDNGEFPKLINKTFSSSFVFFFFFFWSIFLSLLSLVALSAAFSDCAHCCCIFDWTTHLRESFHTFHSIWCQASSHFLLFNLVVKFPKWICCSVAACVRVYITWASIVDGIIVISQNDCCQSFTTALCVDLNRTFTV